jgi:hypothetical protein
MIGIVPLAGPDFEFEDGSVKSERLVDGQQLLRRALESRPWWLAGLLKSEDLIFVMRNTMCSRRFATQSVANWYPRSRFIFLSDYSRGAALSVACATGLVTSYDDPIVVDLCDIMFDCDIGLVKQLGISPTLGALTVTFPSNKPIYSYLECDKKGYVIRSREKEVISDHASAGVYFFNSVSIYWKALSYSIEHRDVLSHNGLIYVCPMINGVIDQGLDVRCINARHVIDIK